MRRRSIAAVIAMALAGATFVARGGGAPTGSAPDVVGVAQSFLATLTPDQRRRVVYASGDDAQRARWSNFPTGVVPRGGIAWRELSASQRVAARTLLATVLSPAGLAKVDAIRQADDDFKVNGSKRGPAGRGGAGGPGGGPGGPESFGGPGGPGAPSASAAASDGRRAGGSGAANGGGPPLSSDDLFGSDLYYLSFVGEPAPDRSWLLQFGGHHLALNVTVAGTRQVLTPSLTGAQPALFKVDGRTVRPLGRESDKALALLRALDERQRRQAILDYAIPDLVLGPGQDGKSIVPDGLRASEMSAEQRRLLMDVVTEWTGLANAPAAAARAAGIEADLDDT